MRWTEILKQAAVPAACATVATTAAVVLLSKLEGGSFAAGLNAVSHMVWGDEAAERDEPDVEHTVLGGALNAAAVSGWAALHEAAADAVHLPRRGVPLLLSSAAVSAAAYLVDYFVVPKRLTPGFEKRLSPRSMFVVYAALAGALAVGSLFSKSQTSRTTS